MARQLSCHKILACAMGCGRPRNQLPFHMRACRRSQNLGTLRCRPLGWGVADPLENEKRSSPHVTIPNLVVLGQTVWAVHRGPNNLEDAGRSPLAIGTSMILEIRHSPHVVLCQPWSLNSF